MPKGRSYQEDAWLDFSKGSHTFVHDNFAHEKVLTFKAKLQNDTNGATIKESLTERPDGVSSTGQIRYWFNLKNNRSCYSRVATDSNIEVQYDNGIRSLKGVNNNLYFGALFNRTFTERQGFVGLQLFVDGKWSVNGKFSYDYASKAIEIDQKLKYFRDGWKLEGYSSIDSLSKLLGKCGVLLGYEKIADGAARWNTTLRFERSKETSQSLPKVLLSNVTVNINNNLTQTQTVGLESKFSIMNLIGKIFYQESNKIIDSLWLCSEWRLGETTVKAKLSKDLSHAICIRKKLGRFGTYSLGVEASDFTNKLRYKFGIKLDLSL